MRLVAVCGLLVLFVSVCMRWPLLLLVDIVGSTQLPNIIVGETGRKYDEKEGAPVTR